MEIGVVIVIYNTIYNQSKSYLSLIKCACECQNVKFHLVIYDNSQEPQDVQSDNSLVHTDYYHDKRNLGVVPAYNYAIDYCKQNGIKWLLRLDHDSVFDSGFIDCFVKAAEDGDRYSAIIPKIICNNRIISPSIIKKGGHLKSIPADNVGVSNERITFINSMSFINLENDTIVDAIRDTEFLLDLSDHDVAYRLKPNSVYVLDVVVNHSLSVSESEYVGIERYRRIIGNEVSFVNLREDLSGRLIFKVRLLLRGLKLISKGMYKHALLTYANILK